MNSNTNLFLEKLLNTHLASREHLLKLLDGLSEEQWVAFPTQAKWNIQRTATHIVNAEIYWMRFAGLETPEIDYAGREMTLEEFSLWQQRVSELLQQKVKQEYKEKGFSYVPPGNEKPSFQWVLLRTVQHAIYHSGTITYLRQAIGAKKLGKSDTFGRMADSVTLLINLKNKE